MKGYAEKAASRQGKPGRYSVPGKHNAANSLVPMVDNRAESARQKKLVGSMHAHGPVTQLFKISAETGSPVAENSDEEVLLQKLEQARRSKNRSLENSLLSEIRGKIIVSTAAGRKILGDAATAPGGIARIDNVEEGALPKGVHGITTDHREQGEGTKITMPRNAPVGLSALSLAHEYVHDSEIRAGSLVDPQAIARPEKNADKFDQALDIAASEHFARESEVAMYKELKSEDRIVGEIDGSSERNHTANFFREIDAQSKMTKGEFFFDRFLQELKKHAGASAKAYPGSALHIEEMKMFLEVKRQLKAAYLEKAGIEKSQEEEKARALAEVELKIRSLLKESAELKGVIMDKGKKTSSGKSEKH